MRQLAVERLLGIIGEAANSLSEGFPRTAPGIPWRDVIGLRVVVSNGRTGPAPEIPVTAQSVTGRAALSDRD